MAEQPPSGHRLVELIEVMARLRAECEWKREQTHRSLARYLLEETHETLEAIDTGDATGDWEHLREELGDLLLQVYFHAEIARETGTFDIDDVAGDLIAKMVRRNPHVYGDVPVFEGHATAVQINELWQSIKAQEKQRTSPLDGLPPTLPALLLADKVLDRLARSATPAPAEVAQIVGRGGTNRGPADELGDRLLALVAECRDAGVDPEQALRDAVRRLLA